MTHRVFYALLMNLFAALRVDRRVLRLVGMLLLATNASLAALAGTGTATPTPLPTPAPAPGAPAVIDAPLPIVKRENQLDGKALLDQLRAGGYVLYLRHTETGDVTPQCDRSNLSRAGEEAADQLGRTLSALKIPIAAVHSSPACRVLDTAKRLNLGEVRVSGALHQVPEQPGADLRALRQKLINTAPPAGANLLLVSHMHGDRDREKWIHLQMGETIVFRPSASGPVAVARVQAGDWARLAAPLSENK
jgi:phosphohistidine phosphatase SixA